MFYKFSCNFGLEDKTNVFLKDIHKLLLSTQYKWKQNKVHDTSTKRKGKKPMMEFPKSSQQSQRMTKIGKTMAGMSIKCGCQRSFIAKQPYLDHSICPLIYLHAEHNNKMGELAMRKMFLDFAMLWVHNFQMLWRHISWGL